MNAPDSQFAGPNLSDVRQKTPTAALSFFPWQQVLGMRTNHPPRHYTLNVRFPR